MTNRHDEPTEYDPATRSECGSAAAGDTACPLCDARPPKTELPAHIRAEHTT